MNDGLAEVVEHQRREREAEPAQADRGGAEVAPVGVERLGAGHGQHHAAEHQIAGDAVVDHEPHPPAGRQSLEHGGVLEHLAEAEHADRR